MSHLGHEPDMASPCTAVIWLQTKIWLQMHSNTTPPLPVEPTAWRSTIMQTYYGRLDKIARSTITYPSGILTLQISIALILWQPEARSSTQRPFWMSQYGRQSVEHKVTAIQSEPPSTNLTQQRKMWVEAASGLQLFFLDISLNFELLYFKRPPQAMREAEGPICS